MKTRSVPLRSCIREEAPADIESIHSLNAAAFETEGEARLVDGLRAAHALTLSLVAEVAGQVVGHIAFSPVVVTSERQTAPGLGLGPMAVAPSFQRMGVGGRLIEEGICKLRGAGHRFCVVLGHAEYYPRHGFVPAIRFGIRWERPVPDDIFFVRELAPGGLAGVSGTVRYRPEFDAV
jgi:putative acetyltransferase